MPSRDRILVVDLLCVSPYYDLELLRALQAITPSVALAATSFHLDPDLFTRNEIRLSDVVFDRIARMGIRTVSIRRVLKMLEYFANLLRLRRYCRRGEVKLLHIQWLPMLDWINVELTWLSAIKAANVPIVLTVHNVMPHEARPDRVSSFRRLYNSVDRLICHTQEARKILVDSFGVDPSTISVIPHGPLLVDEASSNGTLGGDSTARLVVLSLGTIKPYKGFDLLLDAWSQVSRTHNNVLLVIAGNGSASAVASLREKVAGLDCAGQVELELRPLSTSDVVRLHRQADIVVFPYRAITQSGALMTAMAFRKAIVATDLPAFREYLETDHCGVLVRPDDAGALASALIELIDDSDRRDVLTRAVEKRLDVEFGWPLIAQKTLACYRSAAKSREC